MMKLLLQVFVLNFLFATGVLCNRRELLQYASDLLANNHVKHLPEPSTPTNVQKFPPSNPVVELEPQFFPGRGSKRVKVKYGPFDVESMAKDNGMVDYLQIGAQMPCTDCTITYLEASLEYPDGSYANANTSLWLHHIVLLSYNLPDTVCGENYIGHQRWFASGNERTPADISLNGTVPVGYYVKPGDIPLMLVELMNQGMEVQHAVPTITYEYIPGFPSDFYKANPVWLDIGGCGNSDQPAKTTTTFEYTSPPYKANFEGAIIGMGGHLHDGGTHLEIFKNSEEVCNCVAYYGQTPGYWDEPGTSMTMPMDPNFSPMEHISSISSCWAPTSMVNPGDEFSIKAYYNLTEYTPMLNVDGTLADIMGITIMYVAEGMTESEMHSFVGTSVAPLAKTPEPTSVAMDMSGMGPGSHMGAMAMDTCVPARDSPGTITTKGLNMKNQKIAMDYLMAILNDTCLQAWSKPFVQYFWYGMVIVIGLFTLTRALQWMTLTMRKRQSAANQSTSGGLLAPASMAASVIRRVSYIQVTPSGLPSVFKVPAFGTILMILGYFGFLMALQFINVSTGDDQNWQAHGVRAAWLSVGQVPLIVLLANKRNFIEFFTAVTYERLNVLHRWTARGLLITTTFHFAFQSVGWARAGVMQLEWSSDTCPPTGIAAYALVLWMNLSTLAPFRNFSYEFFVIQHIVTFMGLIIAIMIHIPTTALFARTYIYIAVGLYLFSRGVQTAIYAYHNIRPSRANTTRVSENVTKISVAHGSLKSWRAGSFVLISLPRFGIFQSHPATIASTPTSHGGELVVYLRKHKGFTRRIARDSAHSNDHVALIDGPYGGRQSDLAAYQTVVLVAGSTGISFTLPILLDMAARASQSKLPVQEVHFVWATKDQAFLSSLRGNLRSATAALRAAGINVSVQVHITGAYEATSDSEKSETSSNDSSSDLGSADAEKRDAMPTRVSNARTDSSSTASAEVSQSGITVTSGRPSLGAVLAAAKAKSAGEMGIAVCGPLGMSAEVRNEVSRMQGGHGAYLHVEGFAW